VLDHSNQAADADGSALDQWLKEQNITVPVGSIKTDAKKATLAWGVKSLPWLILTASTWCKQRDLPS